MRNLSPEQWQIVLSLQSPCVVPFPLRHSCELALQSSSLDWVLHQFIPCNRVWFHYFVVCWQFLSLILPSSPSLPHLGQPIRNPSSFLLPWQTMQAPICAREPSLTAPPPMNHNEEPKPVSFPCSLVQEYSLCVWLLSVSIMLLRFIVLCVSVVHSFLLLSLLLCGYIDSPVDGHLSCLKFWLLWIKPFVWA